MEQANSATFDYGYHQPKRTRHPLFSLDRPIWWLVRGGRLGGFGGWPIRSLSHIAPRLHVLCGLYISSLRNTLVCWYSVLLFISSRLPIVAFHCYQEHFFSSLLPLLRWKKNAQFSMTMKFLCICLYSCLCAR